MIESKTIVAAAFAILTTAGCVQNIRAVAPRPAPRVAPRGRIDAQVAVRVNQLTDEPTCSEGDGRRVCVSGFQNALGWGLRDLFVMYGMRPVTQPPPTFVATMRIEEMSHEQIGSRSVAVYLRWHFALTDAQGTTLFEVGERTRSPELVHRRDARDATFTLVNAVVERIAFALNESPLWAPPPAAMPATAPAQQVVPAQEGGSVPEPPPGSTAPDAAIPPPSSSTGEIPPAPSGYGTPPRR